jgi:hypothetical protein
MPFHLVRGLVCDMKEPASFVDMEHFNLDEKGVKILDRDLISKNSPIRKSLVSFSRNISLLQSGLL